MCYTLIGPSRSRTGTVRSSLTSSRHEGLGPRKAGGVGLASFPPPTRIGRPTVAKAAGRFPYGGGMASCVTPFLRQERMPDGNGMIEETAWIGKPWRRIELLTHRFFWKGDEAAEDVTPRGRQYPAYR